MSDSMTNPEEQSEKIDDLSQIMGHAVVLVAISRDKDGGALLTMLQPKNQSEMSFHPVVNDGSELGGDTFHFETDKKAWSRLSGMAGMIAANPFCRIKKG